MTSGSGEEPKLFALTRPGTPNSFLALPKGYVRACSPPDHSQGLS